MRSSSTQWTANLCPPGRITSRHAGDGGGDIRSLGSSAVQIRPVKCVTALRRKLTLFNKRRRLAATARNFAMRYTPLQLARDLSIGAKTDTIAPSRPISAVRAAATEHRARRASPAFYADAMRGGAVFQSSLLGAKSRWLARMLQARFD